MKHLSFPPGRLTLTATLVAGLVSTSVLAVDDALDSTAQITPMAERSLLMDIDRVGNRLIAVGERGHILSSNDDAQSWQQLSAPVRVTLTASYFVNDKLGFVVGHDGVVLRTNDGGQSWTKLLDGYKANELVAERARAIVAELEAQIDATEDEIEREELEFALEDKIFAAEDAELFIEEGPSRPFLDVWFKDDKEGFIVGAFGLIFHTTDGGETWTPWFDRLENPDGFHLNAVRHIGDKLYITAEAGSIFRSDDGGQSFELLDSPYEGSFFGIIGNGQGALIAHGLRGNAYISHDQGDSWQRIDTGIDASLFGATLNNEGNVVLAGNGGNMLHVDNKGVVVKHTRSTLKLPISAITPANADQYVLTGFGGIQLTQ